MPPTKCSNCMDAGFVMYDGVPRACGSCDAGRDYEQNGGRRLDTVPRRELDPRTLPPGGDVLITEMKRSAAGLPVGVIGGDVLVRAQIESQPLVHDLVRTIHELIAGGPDAVERALALLGKAPTWAIPDDVLNPPVDDDEPPPEQQDTLIPDDRQPKARPARQRSQRQTAGAPLEPPPE